jgi:hypothetical protein
MRWKTCTLNGLFGITAAGWVMAADLRIDNQPALDQAVVWLKRHDRFGPEGLLVKSVLQDVRAYGDYSQDLRAELGSGLTRSGRPYLLYIRGGEFFDFALDEDQMGRLGLRRNLSSVQHLARIVYLRRTPPAARIEGLEIDHAENLDGTKPFVGRVRYRMLKRPEEQIRIRQSYSTGQSTMISSPLSPDALAGDEGLLTFTIHPINSDDDKHEDFFGPLIIFVELTTSPQGDEAECTILSNTLAVLVNVAEPEWRADAPAELKPSTPPQSASPPAATNNHFEPEGSESLDKIHRHAHELDETKPGEAESLFRQALAGYRDVSLNLTLDLADLLFQSGRAAEAEPLYRGALTEFREQLQISDAKKAGVLATLALSLLQQSKWTEADPILRQALAIREKLIPDAWNTFATRSLIGRSLLGQKKYEEAEPWLLSGYKGMKAREGTIPAAGRPRLVEALERLVQLYEALNKKDEAAKWRTEWEAAKAAQEKSTKHP